MDKVKLTIDGKEIETERGQNHFGSRAGKRY